MHATSITTLLRLHGGDNAARTKSREPPSGFRPSLTAATTALQTVDPPRGQPGFQCVTAIVGRRVTDENIRRRGLLTVLLVALVADFHDRAGGSATVNALGAAK